MKILTILSFILLVATTNAQKSPEISNICIHGSNIVIRWDSEASSHVLETATSFTNTFVVVSPVLTGLSAEVPHETTTSIAFFRVRSVHKLNITDPNLVEALRNILAGKAVSSTALYDIDLLRIEDLNANTRGISSLEGIQHATHLEFLNLGYTNWNSRNHIRDISFLASLTNITSLNLNGNDISDLSPLSGLVQLQSLELGWNQISDVAPLAGLESLNRLRINDNQITNIDAICGLHTIRHLKISNNPKADYSSLGRLENLEELSIAGNNITNLAFLSLMPHLKMLYASWNPISTLSPLATVLSLEQLYLYDVQIADLGPLVENAMAGGLSTGAVLNLHGMPLNSETLTQQIPLLEKLGIIVKRR